MVRAFGFAPKTLPVVELTAARPDVDVGVVALAEIPLQLQKQSVTAQREEVQIQPDRTTYVVRDMPTTKGGTALDVLRNLPSVDVDIDNNVSLRGNSGVVIQINGRPSALKAAQLGNFLAQLPADAVDHVEIIPNPSARDDADGVAGIINIVLRQKPDAGTSGGVTVGAGTTGHIDTGINGGWQRGPLSAYGSYSLLRDNSPRYDAIFRQDSFDTPLTYLQESGTRTQIPLIHTVTGTATYQPSDHDELSADGLYSQRREWETYGIMYHTLDTSLALTNLTDRHSRDVNHEGSAEAALNYKHDFATKGHKLSSELRFEEHFEGGPTDILDQSLWPTSAPPTTTLQQTRTVWTHSSGTSLKLDYVQPLASGWRLETGYKGFFQRIRTTQDVQNFDAAQSAMLTDTTQTSDFSYDELVHDAYGMLVAKVGRVQFQGGLRAEHAGTTFDLRNRDQRYDNPYNSLFPSGLVSFALDDADQLKLSYSTRIRRPDDPDLLDPTPHALDALNISVGNPYLRPEYIRALELGLQRTGDRVTMQLTPFYRHSLDAVRSIRTIDSAGVTTRSYANIATTDAVGTDATVALSGGSGQRIHWRQRVSPAKQRRQSRSDAVGEHVRLERPHQHGVPYLADGGCTGARVVRRADDDRARLERGAHARQLRRPRQARRRPPQPYVARDRPVQHRARTFGHGRSGVHADQRPHARHSRSAAQRDVDVRSTEQEGRRRDRGSKRRVRLRENRRSLDSLGYTRERISASMESSGWLSRPPAPGRSSPSPTSSPRRARSRASTRS